MMLTRGNVAAQKHSAGVVPATRRCVRVRAFTSQQKQQQQELLAEENASSSRRQLLLSIASLSVASGAMLTGSPTARAEGEAPPAAAAEPPPYKIFYGLASPPTSYGGYGGNANEVAKYTFEYPSDWKTEVPSKVEKGTQGIDGRVVSKKIKDVRAFVITLGRAGEDNKSFILRDTDSTFAGFAGADYNLQDALTSATSVEKSNKKVDGLDFFDFDIDSPDFHYLSSIAVKDGKVFALFVRSPTRAFKSNEDKLRHIIDTFRLL